VNTDSVKTILITGGSCGIGRATALLAATRGWSVAVNFLKDEGAAARTAVDDKNAGARAVSIQGDVSIEADIVAMFDSAEASFGRLDGLVNNAGIVAPPLPLSEMSAERLRRMFTINVYGVYLCARKAARRLNSIDQKAGGAIVNVSSAALRLGSPNEYVDYAGLKAAIDTLTIGLAKKLGPRGVWVNAVRPGLIETDIHASGGQPDRAERLGKTTPLGRPSDPKEVAEAIIWLLSDASSYVTGALLDVAAGR
jgi:NAD(P)-dependent dehydrogenase (short-subunit alcohol dehydrogenase family)